jgi:penicillin-binding protein 2
MPDPNIPADFHKAVLDSFPGSGDVDFPLNPDTWTIITDGMAAATTTGTAAAAHMQGIDFAGKTGTAQVVGSGDTHVKGGAKTPNSWFVGMVPRRNPEIVIAVLQEHGDWGANSARIAAQIVAAYVNKKRMQDHNVLDQAGSGKPVEVGAVWSEPAPSQCRHAGGHQQASVLHAGHFSVDPAPPAEPRSIASSLFPVPSWLGAPTCCHPERAQRVEGSAVRTSVARVGNHEPKSSSLHAPSRPLQFAAAAPVRLGNAQP